MLWSAVCRWRLETSRRLVTRVGDNAIVLNQDGIDFAAMESEHAKQLQAIIVPSAGRADRHRAYP
jgi:hypothetical protein